MKFVDLSSRVKTISPDDVRKITEEQSYGNVTLLDVREPVEYEHGHIPGALFIPLSQLPDRLSELDPDKPVLAY